MDIDAIGLQVKNACLELIDAAGLAPGQILVLGASSSEICGGVIGKASNTEVGAAVAAAALSAAGEKGVFLAVQGCEHINRALAVERAAAERYNLEIVGVVPVPKAGGPVCAAAYGLMDDPVMAEHINAHAGLDIGDTSVGMHVRFVQVPVRLSAGAVGAARVTALKSRLKLIGGERAVYKV